MERLVIRIGNEPAVPTKFDMDFAFDLDKGTFDGLQRIFNQLCDLTDILGDEYNLDRLRELKQADDEGRVTIEPKARKCPKCGKMRLFHRTDWKYYYCYSCKTQFTKEQVESALRREQDG